MSTSISFSILALALSSGLSLAPEPAPNLDDPFASGGAAAPAPAPAPAPAATPEPAPAPAAAAEPAPVAAPEPAPAPVSDPFAEQAAAGGMGSATVTGGPQPQPQPEQPRSEPRGRERKVGFFVGFDTRLSEVDYRFATTLGGLAGVVLAKRLMIGGGGYSMVFHDRKYTSLTDTRTLNLDYGGGQLGVYALRSPKVDGGFNVFLGGGQLCLESSVSGNCASKTSAFVSHLDATVYIRFASVLRLGLSFGYNFIVDTTYAWAGPSNWAMSGFSGSIRLEFGKFQPGGGRRGRR